MTVPSDAAQPPRDEYVEDGATLVHAINFTFENASEISVQRILVDGTEILLVNPTHYTVAGGLGATGSITKTTAASPARRSGSTATRRATSSPTMSRATISPPRATRTRSIS
jgi:hypothetical protein